MKQTIVVDSAKHKAFCAYMEREQLKDEARIRDGLLEMLYPAPPVKR